MDKAKKKRRFRFPLWAKTLIVLFLSVALVGVVSIVYSSNYLKQTTMKNYSEKSTELADTLGVVVNVDGKIIYEAGDTCLRLDRINEIPQPIDVLIAPINGAYGNLDENECAVLSEAIHPGFTIPCHYGMFASHHGDVGRFYDIMVEKKLPFLLMQQGEIFTF